MAQISKDIAITFDDVLIKPRYSNVLSREDVSTVIDFLGLKMMTPIISANMDTITDVEMAKAMYNIGGLGILHRFMSEDLLRAKIAYLKVQRLPIAFSVGTRESGKSYSFVREIADNTDNDIYVTIDVAHGHHASVGALINDLRQIENVKVIAGNVATREGYNFLTLMGAHAVKVGIGPGAACTTREVTGIGVPQLSAIMDIADARGFRGSPLIIADGGIKNSGDIVKALAAGADVVMLGSLLAGCPETPQEPRSGPEGQKWYQYRGQSTIGSNKEKYAPEGVSGFVMEKPPVAEVIHTLTSGLRSGMSYVGAHDLTELRQDIEFVRVSPNARLESETRVTMNY